MFQVWFFPQQFPSRCISFLSYIGNNNYNISGYLCDMWTIKTESYSTKHSLQHIKGIEAADPRFQETYCTCKMQWYVIGMLLIIC